MQGKAGKETSTIFPLEKGFGGGNFGALRMQLDCLCCLRPRSGLLEAAKGRTRSRVAMANSTSSLRR